MFNPLTPAELTTAMGRTARTAARSEEPSDPFLRAQLMSVFSASRHLAVELSPAFDAALRDFVDSIGDARVGESSDPREVGDLVCELLDRLRTDTSQAAAAQRRAVRTALAQLADREVELFAAVIEGSA